MPVPKEIFLAMCRNDPNSVYRMFCTMEESIARLEQRVKYLESIINKDSHNSGKPPSSDMGRKQKSLRGKSKRRKGGQPGHKGHTLQRVDNPQHSCTHSPEGVCSCGRPLQAGTLLDFERRQVFDTPVLPPLEVTEHCAEIRQCPCGKVHTAAFPAGVEAPVQYGERIRALMVYFSAYQLLPQKRTVEVMNDLFGVKLSEGTLNNAIQQAHSNLGTTEEAIKQAMKDSPVMHLDETGMYVNGKRFWEHSCSTPLFTHYFCHPKRGGDAIKEGAMLNEYLGRIVHDGWKPYFDFECLHALCNAHHLRELIFMKEEHHQQWADTMIEFLCRLKRVVDRAKAAGQSSLAKQTIQRYERRYDQIIAEGYDANPKQTRKEGAARRGRVKQHPARNLLDRLSTYRHEVLIFMHDFDVPFDNNLAERDLRMTKVKQKVSGCFRSMSGAQAFCRIRGFISTVRKHGYGVLEHMQKCFAAEPETVLLHDLT